MTVWRYKGADQLPGTLKDDGLAPVRVTTGAESGVRDGRRSVEREPRHHAPGVGVLVADAVTFILVAMPMTETSGRPRTTENPSTPESPDDHLAS